MRLTAIAAAFLALALVLPGPAAAAEPGAPVAVEQGIRAAVARWYEELLKKDKARIWGVVAPGFIDSTPPYYYPRTRSRAGSRPVYNSLAATALKFAWEIDAVRRDRTFAKVRVWEHGYFYAYSAQVTYERAAATTFILERQEKDGQWLILAHQSGSYGIPPHKVTKPVPDLRDLFYATEGKGRDPAKDARDKPQF